MPVKAEDLKVGMKVKFIYNFMCKSPGDICEVIETKDGTKDLCVLCTCGAEIHLINGYTSMNYIEIYEDEKKVQSINGSLTINKSSFNIMTFKYLDKMIKEDRIYRKLSTKEILNEILHEYPWPEDAIEEAIEAWKKQEN